MDNLNNKYNVSDVKKVIELLVMNIHRMKIELLVCIH